MPYQLTFNGPTPTTNNGLPGYTYTPTGINPAVIDNLILNSNSPYGDTLSNGSTPTENGYTSKTPETSEQRAKLLDAVLKALPKVQNYKGGLYTREELNIQTISDQELLQILDLLTRPAFYMPTLVPENTLLFQKEVIDLLISGVEFGESVIKATAAIRGNIYLYDEAGNAIPDETKKPTTTTKNGNTTLLVLLGIGVLILAK